MLGTLNGVATSVSAVGRAAGPAIGGAVFSWGVGRGWVGLAWWTLAGLAAGGAVPVFWLVEMEGFAGGEGSEDGADKEEEEEDKEEGNVGGDEGLLAARHDGEGEAAERGRDVLLGDDLIPESQVVATEEEEGGVLAVGNRSPLLQARVSKTESAEMNDLLMPRSAESRMSGPLGTRDWVGPGRARRLSNGLGTTRSGVGAWGTGYR